MKMILCLKHGQADIERGFSINKNLLKDNMKEASLIVNVSFTIKRQ